jgi:hypothetical protein
MSISLDREQAHEVDERALGVLRTRDNPFESLASPHRASENFSRLHEQEIHRLTRERLIQAIDTYRLAEYSEFRQLLQSRVVTILGDRGSGKTHLLQTLIDRPDRKAQLVVRPSTLEPGLEFEEYLLAQIRIALGERDEFHLHPPLELIAQSLTRRLLLQALRQLSPTQQLFALSPDAARSWRLLWGGAAKPLKKWTPLLNKLSESNTTQNLHDLILAHGLVPDQAVKLVESHLRRMEASTSPLLIVRRSLYTAMARRVLLEDNEVLPRFLREDYLLAGGVTNSSRAELVRPLLQVLVEACALCRIPVVFAFDNFEQLFSPLGRFDNGLARVFFNNLAQSVDTTHGILFLLFFERGLYDAQATPHLDEFCQARFNLGVRMLDKELLASILLAPPTAKEVTCLVHTRVQWLLADCPEASQLCRSFPFAEKYPEQLTGTGSVNLRNILIALRDTYAETVFRLAAAAGPGSEGSEPPPVNWNSLLDAAWARAMEHTRRVASEATHQEFHESLGILLQALGNTNVEGWTINNLLPTDPIGEHPSYGVVTRIDWRQAGGANLEGPKDLKVGIGFLLAVRRGTLVDLRSKFDYFKKYERGARLVILWPTEATGDLIASMSDGTREVWDANREYHHKTQIRRIAELDLRRLLCLRVLPRYLEEATPPIDVYAEFLRDRLGVLLPLLVPPSTSTPE